MDKKSLQAVLEAVAHNGLSVAMRVADQAGVSRQTASKWLSVAQDQGLISASGTGRGRSYHLTNLVDVSQTYSSADLPITSEDQVWREVIAPKVADLPENVITIWQYGFTEMLNNAIEHSGATQITVGVQRTALHTTMYVSDDGEGVFLKLQRVFRLYDPRESILELSKGKLTTDPSNHSGEGIFFTSKSMDSFAINSGRLVFRHDAGNEDILLEKSHVGSGTLVLMRLSNQSNRVLREVYDEFTSADHYDFSKTIVPVRLAKYENEGLISRSQGKRLTLRFERFKIVILDFEGVNEIGQAFADEVFRVFQNSHPDLIMTPINMTEYVEKMVRRATERT